MKNFFNKIENTVNNKNKLSIEKKIKYCYSNIRIERFV